MKEQQPPASTSTLSNVNISSWQTFCSENLGFQFLYPEKWGAFQKTQKSLSTAYGSYTIYSAGPLRFVPSQGDLAWEAGGEAPFYQGTLNLNENPVVDSPVALAEKVGRNNNDIQYVRYYHLTGALLSRSSVAHPQLQKRYLILLEGRYDNIKLSFKWNIPLDMQVPSAIPQDLSYKQYEESFFRKAKDAAKEMISRIETGRAQSEFVTWSQISKEIISSINHIHKCN